MTGPVTLASVVEGYGDVAALPVLLRRIARECFDCHEVQVSKPHRVPRDQMTRGDYLGRAVAVQGARVTGRGGVLIVADADDDCPLELARTLAKTAGGALVAVAVANREFEAWFLAGIESLRGHRLVVDDASFPGDPDSRRGAKEALADRMREKYIETLHQPAFASLVNIAGASARSRSFRHLVGAVGRLIEGSPASG